MRITILLIQSFILFQSATVFADVFDDPRAADEIEVQIEAQSLLGRNEFVKQGRAISFTILAKAKENTNSSFWSSLYGKITNILDDRDIIWPKPGFDLRACGENILAFVIPKFSRNIFLCAHSFSMSTKALGQTLIHESSHLVGYMNECDATRIEVNAMIGSGDGLEYRNIYMDKCGIS